MKVASAPLMAPRKKASSMSGFKKKKGERRRSRRHPDFPEGPSFVGISLSREGSS